MKFFAKLISVSIVLSAFVLPIAHADAAMLVGCQPWAVTTPGYRALENTITTDKDNVSGARGNLASLNTALTAANSAVTSAANALKSAHGATAKKKASDALKASKSTQSTALSNRNAGRQPLKDAEKKLIHDQDNVKKMLKASPIVCFG